MELNLFLIPLVTGLIYLLAAILMLRFPPPKINYWYGYRSPRSVKSQKAWDHAQQFASTQMMRSGGILCVVSLSGYLMNIRVSENTAAFTGVGITILSALIPIIATEISLRKKFGKE